MKHNPLIQMLVAVMGLVVLPANAAPFCAGESAPARVDLRTGQGEEYMFESGETEITFALDTTKNPAEVVDWQEERTLAVDTRKRIIVASPEEVLPIAYSTNFWATSEDAWQFCESASVSVIDRSGTIACIVSETNVNGTAAWKPSEGAFGCYSLKHHNGGVVTHDVGAEIYYSKPARLTVAPSEGGTVVAITNGVFVTDSLDVLGYAYVNLKATPADEKWQFAEWSVLTNGGAVALLWDETHPTNRFEMPLTNVTATGRFVISDAYRTALDEAATNSFLAASNVLETLRGNRLSHAEMEKILASANGCLDAAVRSLAVATRPSDADEATNTLATALAQCETDAKRASGAKPWTVTVDASGTADGTNVFNAIDAAFAATDILPYATNLVVIGEQRATKPMPAMTRAWNLVVSNWTSAAAYDAAKSPYRQSRLVLGAASQTANFTDRLARISGEGRILVDRAAGDGAFGFATALNGKVASGEKVEALAALQTLTLSDAEFSGEQVAIDALVLENVTVTNWTALSAPSVTQDAGFFAWDLRGDNHATRLANYDDAWLSGEAVRQIRLDADQTGGSVITNYALALRANAAAGQAFELVNAEGLAINPINGPLRVGGETVYVGSKAYTLALAEDAERAGTSNLVFDIAWGRFPIAYDAAGGAWADGTAVSNLDAYVTRGYAFPAEDPTRGGYVFNGWYRGLEEGAERVVATNVSASAVTPLEGHALYAHWLNRLYFEATRYAVVEGGALRVRVWGGSPTNAVQATVTCQKNTGAYSAVYVGGKKVSFPLTLSWTKGDVSAKEILFQTTASSRADGDKCFTLQLGAPVGEVACAENDVCTVTITDKEGGDGLAYVRALAWPAHGGTVSGGGTLANAKSCRTLSASVKNGSQFAGWFKARADNAGAIDFDAPVCPTSVRNPRQIRVGYGTGNGAGTYFAYFTNVLEVAAVAEPVPFDGDGKPLAGVVGVTAWNGNGVYRTMVGVKFALPVGFTDGSGKGRLAVSKLPPGLAYNAKTLCISGVPTEAGTYDVSFIASNAAGRHTLTYAFEVAGMPAAAVGTFAGVVRADDLRAGVGSVSFTAGKTGSLSAKVVRRLSGQRSFSVKGYDYIDANTLGIAMTNSYREIFEAKLSLTNGWYDTAVEGTAFGGGTRKGTLGFNSETNGVFAAVRNAFSNADMDPAAQQILAAFRSQYAETLYATNGCGEAEAEVGSVLYRVNAQGSVYAVARLARTSDGAKTVAAKTFSGSVSGGFVYDDATGVGSVSVAFRSGTSVWSADVCLDYGTLDVTGWARLIRPNAADKAAVVDVDEAVGARTPGAAR